MITASRQQVSVLRCDHCETYQVAEADETIPEGWFILNPRGWLGDLHACSKECKEAIERTFRSETNDSTRDGGTEKDPSD